MKIYRFTSIAAYCISAVICVSAQNYSAPLRIPLSLSAGFGELRNNHFHSGLDYRTQLSVNKPVYSIGDGWVSRINVSPGGFGLALYISHPGGQTSVYGHLNSYSEKIAGYVRQKQYEQETYRIDIQLKPDEIPVKKGDLIALSGNTGSSGGPHLHFEIRDTKTEEPLDPLNFLDKTMTDTQSPDIRGIAIYPQEGKGIVNGSTRPVRISIPKTKSGACGIPDSVINAWGIIGTGVKAYDRMNGTANTLGIENIELFVDGTRIFKSTVNRFSFDKTRMINSFIDFEEWRNNKSFYMKSFVEPGNTLPLYETRNNGYISINEERNYDVSYVLTDHYGNKTTCSFTITGRKQIIPPKPACTVNFAWLVSNWYGKTDFQLTVPSGNLYSDMCYNHSQISSPKYFSDIHQVNNKPVPLFRNALMWIRLNRKAGRDSTGFGIVEIAKKGEENWLGGKYKNGGIEGTINELGSRFAIARDTIAPLITPLGQEKWVKNKRIIIRLKDEKSGIAFYRGEIDGKFALFASDVKSDSYTCVFDESRFSTGQTHRLVFRAADSAGNRSEYTCSFVY